MSPESDPAHRNVHQAVQEHYTATARAHLQVLDIPSAASGAACCGGGGCCGSSPAGSTTDDPITRNLYDPHTPFEAALAASLGCGNPTALAALAIVLLAAAPRWIEARLNRVARTPTSPPAALP